MVWVIDDGRVELRPSERVLAVSGAVQAIGARAFDVLLALVERHDRVVSKNELMDLVWPGMVVEENNLTVQISSVRKLLGAQAIATVTGRGYRLTLKVAQGGQPSQAAARMVARVSDTVDRRLVALVALDVPGWARWVNREAQTAVLAWRTVRHEMLEPSVAPAGGTVVELAAERTLVHFASVVRALEWALSLQARLAVAREARQVASIHLRVGICVDDAVEDEGRLLGDCIPMVTHLVQQAHHDDILVTAEVMALCADKLAARFEPLGPRTLPGKPQPRPLFKAMPDLAVLGAAAQWDGQARRHQWPLLAVLPFDEDGEAAGGYFGDGLAEEVAGALSLHRGLLVVGHSSALRFKGQAHSPAQAARELGADFLVTGKVLRAAQHLSIAVTLLDASRDQVVWRHRYQGSNAEWFAFQAEIARSVSATITPLVEQAEMDRVHHSPTGEFQAYDLMLRALPGMYEFGTEAFVSCGQLLQQAVALDPGFARAHAHLAWWHSLVAAEGDPAHTEASRQLALAHAMQAVRLDARDVQALAVAGHLITLFERRHAEAMGLFDLALGIDPGNVWALARSATTLAYQGLGEEALQRVREAMRLSPFDRSMFSFLTTAGMACMVLGRAAEALAWLSKARRLRAGYLAAHRLQVACLVAGSHLDEARAEAEALQQAHPGFSVAAFVHWYPLVEPHRSLLQSRLRTAGLRD